MTFDSALMGDLVLAIGGGVGGALIFVLGAAVTGRNAGLGLIVAGLVLGAVGLPVGWGVATHLPTLAAPASSNPAVLASEKDLERVMKRYYPDDYAKLRSTVFSFNDSQARKTAVELLQREAPKADDDSMMSMIRLADAEAKQARESSSEQCAMTVRGGGLPHADDALKTEATEAFAHYLEQTATDPASPRPPADLDSLSLRLAKSSVASLPEDEQHTVLIDGGRQASTLKNGDTRVTGAFCDLIIAMLDNLSEGSPHESAALMRDMISRTSRYKN